MSTFYMGVVAPSVILLPMITALLKVTFWTRAQRVVFFYLIFCLLFNATAMLTAYYGVNNMPILHLYTMLEFLMLSWIYICFFQQITLTRLLVITSGIFIIYAAYYGWENSFYKYNVYPRFLGSILIVFISLVYLAKNLSKPSTIQLNFKLMITVGLLFYYASASALFGFSGKLLELTRSTEGVLWNIHATIMLLMYLIFSYAYWKYPKPT